MPAIRLNINIRLFVRSTNMYGLIIMLISMLIPAISFSDDSNHLVPDVPYVLGVDKYSICIKEVFKDGYTNNVILRTLVVPSFGPEYVVGLHKVKNNYYVFVQNANESILHTISRVANSESACGSVSVDKNQREIPSPIADQLRAIWQKEILKTRYAEHPSLIIDGTTYHFSMFAAKHGLIGGRTSIVKKGSLMESLTKLVTTLKEYVNGTENIDGVRRSMVRIDGVRHD